MKNRNDWRTENFLYCMPIREVINVTRVFRISEKIQTLPFVFKNTCEEKSKDKFYDIFCFSKKKLDQLVAPFPRQLRSATIGLEEFLGGKGRQSVVHYFDDQVLHLLRYFGLDFSEHFLRVFVQEIVDGFAC